MSDTERLEELAEVAIKDVFLFPKPEQHSQGGHDVHLVGGMGKDKGDNVFLGNFFLMVDSPRLKMMQELAEIQAVVTDGGGTSAQVGQMLYQLLHLPPQLTIQPMIDWRDASLADGTGQQHVVQHLDASDFLPLLGADGFIVMARVNEHGTCAWVVHFEASGLHERDNAMPPKRLVLSDTFSSVVVFFEERDALPDKGLDVLLLHNL